MGLLEKEFALVSGPKHDFSVPTLSELGFQEPLQPSPFLGGEDEAKLVMEAYFKDKKKTAQFEKPKTSPAAFEPASTTVLSPHLKVGDFYVVMIEIEARS